MPEQFFYTEVQPVECIEIKVPIAIESVDVEAVIDDVSTLPELAIKIDKILASVRDLKGTPVFVDETKSGDFVLVPHTSKFPHRDIFVKKIIVSGNLHKQVFYVNKNNEVRHTAEDLPFSKMVELKEPKKIENKNDVFVQFHNIDIDVNWELQRACRVHETSVVQVTAKVAEDRQIFVQTCPSPKECPAGNLVKDGGIEAWADTFHPVFWGASNVAQTTTAHSGSFAAELGVLNTLLPASLFQMVHRGIVSGRQYRLTFFVREDVLGATSSFSLNAEVVFFDRNGVQVGVGSQTLPCASIPDNSYSQAQFTTPFTDVDVSSAMVRFTFTPGAGNTNTVKVDDVMLECVAM
ncbi:MAG: hypothetical protein A4E55_00731 [Pelotomaculum sp. PtaU1.Bin035]|nr:MAG: hypothetical protein A4E55_00731 [Pelotomaculum sp. PtaU1.Bin035]